MNYFHDIIRGLFQLNCLNKKRAVTSLIVGYKGVNWQLGFTFLLTGKIGLDFLGLGFGNEKVNWERASSEQGFQIRFVFEIDILNPDFPWHVCFP